MNPEHFARSDLDDLIDRAAAALSVSGVETQDVIDVMVEDGVDPGDAILAAHAAAILVRTREWLEEHGEEYEENRTVFHGSARAFAPERAYPMEGSYGPGIYFTSKEFGAKKFAQDGGQIIACDITLQNPVDYFAYLSGPDEYIGTSDKVRESWSPMERVMKWALSAATSLFPDASSEEVAAARERGRLKSHLLTMLGYDGIIVDFSHPNAKVPRTASPDEVYYILFSLYGKNCKVMPQGSAAVIPNVRKRKLSNPIVVDYGSFANPIARREKYFFYEQEARAFAEKRALLGDDVHVYETEWSTTGDEG